MPVPAFDGILNVLPPHLGDPRKAADLSPYGCTVLELCQRFATSPARNRILDGFLRLRVEFFAFGIQGFQWLDGSFLEDVETREGREPKDMDVVTFVSHPSDSTDLRSCLDPKLSLLYGTDVKITYFIDHYWQPLGSDPTQLVNATRYWYGLFSHRRDGVWKGMLVVDLRDKADDDAARIVLGNQP